MPKFYIESGQIKVIIQAKNPLRACVRSLEYLESNKSSMVEFEDSFFVSEKGFLSDREIIQITIPEETIICTEEVMKEYLNGRH